MRAIDRCAQTNRWRSHAAGEKLMVSFCAIFYSLSTAGWVEQVLILAAMVGLTLIGARISMRDLHRSASVPIGFILLGSAAQAIVFSHDGLIPAIGLGSGADIAKAAFVGIRSLACVSALLFLALTTPLASLIRLAQKAGLNVELIDIATAMLRFVWLTLDCLENAHRSLTARLGYTSNRRMLKSNGMLLAALLPRVFARARRMETGLAARGFSGRLEMISNERLASPVHLTLMAICTTVLVVLSWWLR